MDALADLLLIASGKVRDNYELGDRILMVASDRISTYDAVHPTPIPGKGQVLTGMSVFWFELTCAIVPNHLISTTEDVPAQVRGRALVVARLEMLPVECVVRGYLSGSGWSDYQRSGTVCGIALPSGLRESERLPEPLFTPATKAALGDHDENIDFEGAVAAIGDRGLAERVRDAAIAVYERAAEHARGRGIILADTKFEFGLAPDGTQPSFDKQFVRDWATASGWDRSPPAPAIPAEVVEGTQARYRDAYERIVGEPFAAWLARSGAPV
jgi:phosphoribosylaminoimidazole-succinocarboxamide synthase